MGITNKQIRMLTKRYNYHMPEFEAKKKELDEKTGHKHKISIYFDSSRNRASAVIFDETAFNEHLAKYRQADWMKFVRASWSLWDLSDPPEPKPEPEPEPEPSVIPVEEKPETPNTLIMPSYTPDIPVDKSEQKNIIVGIAILIILGLIAWRYLR